MQVQLVTVARGQFLWGGEWWHRINSVITRVVHHYCSAAAFLPGFASLSRRGYFSRSFEIVLCHISEEERSEELLLQSGADLSSQQFAHWQAEDRRIRDKHYVLELLSELDHCSQWTQESIPDADWTWNHFNQSLSRREGLLFSCCVFWAWLIVAAVLLNAYIIIAWNLFFAWVVSPAPQSSAHDVSSQLLQGFGCLWSTYSQAQQPPQWIRWKMPLILLSWTFPPWEQH